MASNFFTEDLKTADEKTCNAPWSGGKNGKYFRCHFCGHKLVPGDQYRVLYTNDMPKASGNPIVCGECNDTTANLRAKWAEINREVRERFWWLRREA